MPRTTTLLKDETFTFRLDPRMKAEFAKSAAARQKQPAQLLRDLVSEHLRRERRRDFEAEAQRQVAIVNGATANPANDEAAVNREFETYFDSDPFSDEWTA
jgi:hypothetical protein